jgi:ferredoxin-NADP reductase
MTSHRRSPGSRPDAGVPAFEAGQYFALGLVVDGRLLQRPYSTATAPGTGRELDFLIRRVPDGAFTPRLWTLPVGARIRIGRAKGLFTLRPDDSRTHLFIATGTGLAPFLSMLSTMLAPDRPVELATALVRPRAIVVHGASNAAELVDRGRLERISADGRRVRYSPIVSRPDHPASAGWDGLTGRVDARLDELCDAHCIDPGATVAYLCGNPGMIAVAERILTGRGFSQDVIISEQYWPAA